MKRLYLYIIILLAAYPVSGFGQQNFDGFSKLFRYTGDTAKWADFIPSITYDEVDNNLFFAITSIKFYPMPYQHASFFYKTDVNGNILKKRANRIPGYNIGFDYVKLSKDSKSLYWGGGK